MNTTQRAGKHIVSATLRQRIRFDSKEQLERELSRLRCHYEVQDVREANGYVYLLIDKQYNDVPLDRSWTKERDVPYEGSDFVFDKDDLATISGLQRCMQYEADCKGCPLNRGLSRNCRVYERSMALICKLRDLNLDLQAHIEDRVTARIEQLRRGEVNDGAGQD